MEAAARWRCSAARRGGGDTAASGHGLAQVPAPPEGTRELGQDECDHEPAPERPTGTPSQASPVSQKQQGPQHVPPSLLRLGKPLIPCSRHRVTRAARRRDLLRVFHLEQPAKIRRSPRHSKSTGSASFKRRCQTSNRLWFAGNQADAQRFTRKPKRKSSLPVCPDSQPAQPSGRSPSPGYSARTQIVNSPKWLFQVGKDTRRERLMFLCQPLRDTPR